VQSRLLERRQDLVVAQQVQDHVVAGDHHVELPPVMVVGSPHVADREVDRDAPPSRLDLG
jgi:hypothetical protein